MENHYETLGVNENDTHETIKKKYRKLSLKYHPDKPTGDVEMFKKITGAYEVVGDEDKRKEYERNFNNVGRWRGTRKRKTQRQSTSFQREKEIR